MTQEYYQSWLHKFNEWRKNYDKMSYTAHQEFYDTLLQFFPHQSQHTKSEVVHFFERIKQIPPKEWKVCEMGGWNGELAKFVLRRFPEILQWDNYEISKLAIKSSVCKDKRYHIIVADDFIWNLILPYDYNIFLSAHTIEHIKAKHFQKLILSLPSTIRWVYLESPLPLAVGRNWKDNFSTHIFEWGWKDVSAFLASQHFELNYVGRNIRIYKKIE